MRWPIISLNLFVVVLIFHERSFSASHLAVWLACLIGAVTYRASPGTALLGICYGVLGGLVRDTACLHVAPALAQDPLLAPLAVSGACYGSLNAARLSGSLRPGALLSRCDSALTLYFLGIGYEKCGLAGQGQTPSLWVALAMASTAYGGGIAAALVAPMLAHRAKRANQRAVIAWPSADVRQVLQPVSSWPRALADCAKKLSHALVVLLACQALGIRSASELLTAWLAIGAVVEVANLTSRNSGSA